MKIDLPYQLTLRDYQIPLWEAVVVKGVRNTLVVWPRRNGKDLITLNIAIAKALQRVGLYLYIAPYFSQIRSIIWEGADNEGRRFLDYIPPQIIKQKYESRMTVELVNGSFLKFAGADNMDSMMGGNPVGIIRTEASLHKPEGWDYLRPIILQNKGWSLHNGTPRGLNHFYVLAKMAENNDDWFFQHLTCDDTGLPTKEDIQSERDSGMPESLIQQEYYTSFLASSDETFIPLELVHPATQTTIAPEDVKHMKRIMGVDVAFAANGDAAAIAKRQGRLLHPVQEYQGVDNMSFASIIDREARQFRPELIFIDAGRGEGVYSRLWQIDQHYQDIVVPIDFGGKSSDPLYANMTALMMGRLKDWFKQIPVPFIPLDEQLIKEITSPNIEYDGQENKIKMESKKHMKSRGIASPNKLDAVKLTFAEEEEDNILSEKEERMREILPHMQRLEAQRPYDEGYSPFGHDLDYREEESIW